MKSISIETFSDSSVQEVKEGDNVRVVYPKIQKGRSPHRTDGIYKVLKIDAPRDIFWVKYLRDCKKITVVKRNYIQAVISSKSEGSN
jgi:hypothetical protein